jgi:hypothetical protein
MPATALATVHSVAQPLDLDWHAPVIELIDLLTDALIEAGWPADKAADAADDYVLPRLR